MDGQTGQDRTTPISSGWAPTGQTGQHPKGCPVSGPLETSGQVIEKNSPTNTNAGSIDLAFRASEFREYLFLGGLL
jgi:hypothetical protein